jgi:hypothetical protein
VCGRDGHHIESLATRTKNPLSRIAQVPTLDGSDDPGCRERSFAVRVSRYRSNLVHEQRQGRHQSRIVDRPEIPLHQIVMEAHRPRPPRRRAFLDSGMSCDMCYQVVRPHQSELLRRPHTRATSTPVRVSSGTRLIAAFRERGSHCLRGLAQSSLVQHPMGDSLCIAVIQVDTAEKLRLHRTHSGMREHAKLWRSYLSRFDLAEPVPVAVDRRQLIAVFRA